MAKITRLVTLVKESGQKLDAQKLAQQVQNIRIKCLSRIMVNKGWQCGVAANGWEPEKTDDGKGLRYKVQLKMACVSKREREQSVIDAEYETITNAITAEARKVQWDVMSTRDVKGTLKPEKYADVSVPKNWMSYFSHIYGREDQVTLVLSAVHAGMKSNWNDRFHRLLVGPPACIAGTSHVRYVIKTEDGVLRNKKGGPIERLYKRFHGKKQNTAGPQWKRGGEFYIQSMTDEGVIRLNRIADVVYSGKKEVYRITTRSGKSLEATLDHQFRTKKGFKRLSAIAVGDKVYVNSGRVKSSGGSTPAYRPEFNVKYHPNGRVKVINRCTYYRVRKSRAALEAHQNGMSLKKYIRTLNTADKDHIDKLWTIPDGYHVHHLDEDLTNNHHSNLVLISPQDHGLLHMEEASKHIQIYAELDVVVDVRRVGRRKTYDIVCSDPYRNFVAEGFVVHNSGKTEIVRAVGNMVGADSILHLDGTLTSQAGAIKDITERDTIPRIIAIEEIEKADEGQLKFLLGVLDHRAEIRKAQPLKSKILTPSGWKRMRDIRVGDVICHPDGGTTTVLGVYPQGKKRTYKVKFSDGSTTRCCKEHWWTTETSSRRAQCTAQGLPFFSKSSTLMTSDIMKTLTTPSGRRNHYIPMVEPCQFKTAMDLPFHPYVMGALLGNGCFRPNVRSLTTADSHIIEKVKDLLPSEVNVSQAAYNDYRLRGDYYITALSALGLTGLLSVEKFIPKRYLWGDVKQRTELLQGLLDTDGHVGLGCPRYSTSSERLCKDVVFLVQSLGGNARVTNRIPTYEHNGKMRAGQKAYDITINLPPSVRTFSLPRKLNKLSSNRQKFPARCIVSVTKSKKEECQCIRVAAADGLYVTDDFVVTHNTNFRGSIQRTVKSLVLATVNDWKLFSGMMSGALASRFGAPILCPAPDEAILRKILNREIARPDVKGKAKWVDATMKYCHDRGITDPRIVLQICLCGRDDLLTGKYQKMLDRCDASNFLTKRQQAALAVPSENGDVESKPTILKPVFGNPRRRR